MPKITIDELVRGACQDPLFEQAYNSRPARIRRALSAALFDLRERASLTVSEIAERAALPPSEVVRLGNADKKAIVGLDALAAYADATNHSAKIVFVDRQTSEVSAEVTLVD